MYRFVLKHLFPKAHALIEADESKVGFKPVTREELDLIRNAPKEIPKRKGLNLTDYLDFAVAVKKACGVGESHLDAIGKVQNLLEQRVTSRKVSPTAAFLAGKIYGREKRVLTPLLEPVQAAKREAEGRLFDRGYTLDDLIETFSIGSNLLEGRKPKR
ncbi:hypothetical protein HZC09_02885 [Candidatus Micrarchaeota archaeon]|nr:hypothetical protein [Candidatus Micrarchaeota archaeon]